MTVLPTAPMPFWVLLAWCAVWGVLLVRAFGRFVGLVRRHCRLLCESASL
jgi:hypothetical protein